MSRQQLNWTTRDNMKALIFAVFVLAVAGCAVANKTYGPDGQEAYSINCSGSALTWAACEEKAGGICGQSGYTVISRSGDQGAIASAGTGGLFATSVINRTMLVQCGASG